jgi:hypothetical protein
VPHGALACHLDEETRNRIVDEELLPLWEGSRT